MVSSNRMQLSSITLPILYDSHFGSIGLFDARDLASSARSRRRLAESSAHFCARAAKRRASSGVISRRTSVSSASMVASAPAVSRRSAGDFSVRNQRLLGLPLLILTPPPSDDGLR